MPAFHRSVHSAKRSRIAPPFAAVAMNTSVSEGLTRPAFLSHNWLLQHFTFLACFSAIVKILSSPMEKPTDGIGLGPNMPTSSSYLPPPATLPTSWP